MECFVFFCGHYRSVCMGKIWLLQIGPIMSKENYRNETTAPILLFFPFIIYVSSSWMILIQIGENFVQFGILQSTTGSMKKKHIFFCHLRRIFFIYFWVESVFFCQKITV